MTLDNVKFQSDNGSILVRDGANLTLIDAGNGIQFSGTTGSVEDLTLAGNSTLTLQDGWYEFANGIDGSNGGRLVLQNTDATFGAISTTTLSNGLLVGKDSVYTSLGNTTLGGTSGITYSNPSGTDTFSQIDLTGAAGLTLQNGAKFQIYDTNGNAISLESFKGNTGVDGQALIFGNENTTELANLVGPTAYDTLLYNVGTTYDADSHNFVLTSVKKDVDLGDIEGNADAAVELYGEDEILDESSVEDARRDVVGGTGEIFASAAHVQTQRTMYQNRSIISRLQNLESCGNCDEEPANFWISSYGMAANTDLNNNRVGYDYDAWGLMFGGEVLEDNQALGFFYSYGKTNMNMLASQLHSSDHTLGLYAQWESFMTGGYSIALGTVAFSSNEGARDFKDVRFHSKFDAFSSSFMYEKGWHTTGDFLGTLNPYFAFLYTRYDANDFGDEGITVSDNTYDSFRGIFGTRLTKDLEQLCLTAGIAWIHEFGDESASFNVSADGVTRTIFGNGTGRDWMEGTLGLQLVLTERCILSGDYYLFTNKNHTAHAGMGTLTVKF